MSYYTAKIQLIDMVDTPKGPKEKRTTETYLVEALSVTEAEAKVVGDFEKAGVSIDYKVISARESKVIRVID